MKVGKERNDERGFYEGGFSPGILGTAEIQLVGAGFERIREPLVGGLCTAEQMSVAEDRSHLGAVTAERWSLAMGGC